VELLSTGINAIVVALVGLLVAWYAKGRFDALERRMDRLEERMDRSEERMDRFEERMDIRYERVRGDITQMALAIGMRPEPQTGNG